MTLVHLIVFTLKWPSLDLDRVGIAVALHREHARNARRLNTRQNRDPMQRLPVKPYRLFVILVYRVWSHHLHGCEMIWIKSQRHVEQTIQALSQQSRAS